MKLKLDADGHVVVTDGKPIYIHDDGKEIAFDAAGTVATIARLNGEAKGHREAKEAAEKALKAFEGIEDPVAARKAIEKLANMDLKKMVDVGEIEKVKADIAKSYETNLASVTKGFEDQVATLKTENTGLKNTLNNEMIGGSFARSKFISEKSAIPADMVQARFGSAFKIEEGKIAAYDSTGNKLYSRAKPGEVASFEEALEILVDGYPYKEQILRGNNNGGGNYRGGGDNTGGKTITRAAFEKLTPTARQDAVTKQGLTVTD